MNNHSSTKTFFIFLVALLLCLSPIVSGQDLTLQTLPAGMVLDSNRKAETRATIEQAAAANRSDVLYLALHNGIERSFCFQHIETMARSQQAELLRRLLTDEQFIEPREGPIKPGSGMEQMLRRDFVMATSYKLLGERPPNYGRLYTRAELAALAGRLKAIQ